MRRLILVCILFRTAQQRNSARWPEGLNAMRRLLLVFIGLLLLGGCSALRTPPEAAPELPLLPPADYGESVLLKQTLSMTWQQRQQQMLVVAELRPQRLRIVLLSALGQRLATLSYDGVRLESQLDVAGLELPLKQILAQMQLSLWPEAVIRRHFSSTDGWSLSVEGGVRTAAYNNHALYRVQYQQDQIQLDHLRLEYSVTIKTLERQPL